MRGNSARGWIGALVPSAHSGHLEVPPARSQLRGRQKEVTLQGPQTQVCHLTLVNRSCASGLTDCLSSHLQPFGLPL